MKKFTLFPVDGEPSEFEVFGSYAIVVMLIMAIAVSVGPWAVFLFKFTTF